MIATLAVVFAFVTLICVPTFVYALCKGAAMREAAAVEALEIKALEMEVEVEVDALADVVRCQLVTEMILQEVGVEPEEVTVNGR